MIDSIQICLHQILRVLITSTEWTTYTVVAISASVFALGLFKAASFLTRSILSTLRLKKHLLENSRELPVAQKYSVRLYNCEPDLGSFTTGFFHPLIFMSENIRGELSDEELEIVIRHEVMHASRRDPLVLMLFDALSELLWFLPAVRKSVEAKKLRAELECDNYANLHGHDKLAIAKTILKFANLESNLNAEFSPAVSSIRDFIDIRVRALTGENPSRYLKISMRTIFASTAIFIIMFCSLSGLAYSEIDPAGYVTQAEETSLACETGHPDHDLIAAMGLVCPHCGGETQTSPQSSCY
jgi:beta-lactamase regulating signal transducer with metallopeptidase domain